MRYENLGSNQQNICCKELNLYCSSMKSLTPLCYHDSDKLEPLFLTKACRIRISWACIFSSSRVFLRKKGKIDWLSQALWPVSQRGLKTCRSNPFWPIWLPMTLLKVKFLELRNWVERCSLVCFNFEGLNSYSRKIKKKDIKLGSRFVLDLPAINRIQSSPNIIEYGRIGLASKCENSSSDFNYFNFPGFS